MPAVPATSPPRHPVRISGTRNEYLLALMSLLSPCAHHQPLPSAGLGLASNSANCVRSSGDSASSASAARATASSGVGEPFGEGLVRGEVPAFVTLVPVVGSNDRRLPSKLIVDGSSPFARFLRLRVTAVATGGLTIATGVTCADRRRGFADRPVARRFANG